MKELILLLLCFTTIAYGQSHEAILGARAMNADSIGGEVLAFPDGESAMADLRARQAADIASGKKVGTMVVANDSPETRKAIGNTPLPSGKNTYAILVPDAKGRSLEQIEEDEAHRQSVVYSVMRSFGSIVMYTVIFPKNNILQALGVVAIQGLSNYIYRVPNRWNNLQNFVQEKVFKPLFQTEMRRMGIPDSVIDFSGRVGFSLFHSGVWTSFHIFSLGAGDFHWDMYLKTLAISSVGSIAWDETFNKYSKRPEHRVLTQTEYVHLHTARLFLYMILTPLVQRQYLAAEAIGVSLFVAGVYSFFRPAGFLKAKDFAERVDQWYYSRGQLTTLGLTKAMIEGKSCRASF